jgi:Cu+-exporting ATPase
MPEGEAEEVAALEIDPVCGMEVEPPGAGSAEFQGITYYFCSKGCLEDFNQDPEGYLGRPDPG